MANAKYSPDTRLPCFGCITVYDVGVCLDLKPSVTAGNAAVASEPSF